MNSINKTTVAFAVLLVVVVTAMGYLAFGIIPASLFFIGYAGGFILWLSIRHVNEFKSVKWIYWLTFLLFIVHRVEEKVMGFFDVLSEMTGVAKPEILSVPIILLLSVSVGAWLAGPLLAAKNHPIGNFLVWTFFASMGITELAHFIFPFFRNEPYGYFPGMLSVVLLAPVAWIGMYKFSKRPN